mgnify:CR=1 FL=1
MSQEELKESLKKDLLNIGYTLRDQVKGYKPTQYLEIVKHSPPVDAVIQMVRSKNTDLQKLFFEGQLMLSLEYFVLKETKYHPLFTPEILQEVKRKLRDYSPDLVRDL